MRPQLNKKSSFIKCPSFGHMHAVVPARAPISQRQRFRLNAGACGAGIAQSCRSEKISLICFFPMCDRLATIPAQKTELWPGGSRD